MNGPRAVPHRGLEVASVSMSNPPQSPRRRVLRRRGSHLRDANSVKHTGVAYAQKVHIPKQFQS
jgi:hypothetical protein